MDPDPDVDERPVPVNVHLFHSALRVVQAIARKLCPAPLEIS